MDIEYLHEDASYRLASISEYEDSKDAHCVQSECDTSSIANALVVISIVILLARIQVRQIQ